MIYCIFDCAICANEQICLRHRWIGRKQITPNNSAHYEVHYRGSDGGYVRTKTEASVTSGPKASATSDTRDR